MNPEHNESPIVLTLSTSPLDPSVAKDAHRSLVKSMIASGPMMIRWPGKCRRVVPLGVGVKAPGGPVGVSPTEHVECSVCQLDVLLRHRPRSISRRLPAVRTPTRGTPDPPSLNTP